MSLAKLHLTDIARATLLGSLNAGDNYFRLIEDIANCTSFEVFILYLHSALVTDAICSSLAPYQPI